MRWGSIAAGCSTAIVIIALLTGVPSQASTLPTIDQLQAKLATATVPFVPNVGQWARHAAFAAQTFAGTLFVTTEGALVLSLPGRPITDRSDGDSPLAVPGRPHQRSATERGPGWVLTETFVDAAQRPLAVTPRGVRPAVAQVSYFLGPQASHRRGLSTFERIDLGDVFPGITVQLRATGRNVEKIFTVAPHRDSAQIRLHIGGATRLELGAYGELIVHTDHGPLVYTAPIAYQHDEHGQRRPIAVSYELDDAIGGYRFVLAAYDSARPLVIDPLLQMSYLGAVGNDYAMTLAIHPANGEVYVGGYTSSPGTTFPGVGGGAQESHGGASNDAFVSRFNAELTMLLQSSYLGGAADDHASALAIHPTSGEVYVVGYTSSALFPGAGGGAQAIYGGGPWEGFVSRFNAELTSLLQSSYLGAAGTEYASAVAIHPASGDVYVAGYSNSPDTTFPGTGGGAQGNSGGGGDAFVSRLNGTLTTFLQSSYLGAAGSDQALALAIHPASGEVYVAGNTTSPGATFPGVGGGAQGSHGDGSMFAFFPDAFVSRFNAELTALRQSSYLGAAGHDELKALAIHPASGDVYVGGETFATGATFPGVVGGAQDSHGGGGTADAFVSRINAELTALRQSSYLGAGGDDYAKALSIHPASGDVYVAGRTNSSGTTFPGTGGGAQESYGGGTWDAFVSRFNAELTMLRQSTYLGTEGYEEAWAMAIHPVNGEVHVAGERISLGTDAFVSRFSFDLQAADVVPDPFAFAAQAGVPTNVVRTSAPVQIDGLGVPAMVSVSGPLGSAFCISSTNSCECDATPGSAFTATPAPIANNQFLCVRHVSAPVPSDLRSSVVLVGGGVAKFQTYTGSNLNTCSLDVDGNKVSDALTDGLMLIRALFGLTGTSVTANAIGGGATRTTWAQIQPFLNGNCSTNFSP